jgi:hypothetical protein
MTSTADAGITTPWLGVALLLMGCSPDANPKGVDSGTDPVVVETVDGNGGELERRAALAGCTVTVSNPQGITTKIYYDASGWPLQYDLHFGKVLPLVRLRTEYERVDGRVTSSLMTEEQYRTSSQKEYAYEKYGCDQWALTRTTTTYNAAERPTSSVESDEDVCGSMFETDYTFDYTIDDDVLTASTKTRADGVEAGSWTYDACGMVTSHDRSTFEITYREGCDVAFVRDPSEPVEFTYWEDLRPAYTTTSEGDVQDTYVYEGCGAEDASLPTTEFSTRPD